MKHNKVLIVGHGLTSSLYQALKARKETIVVEEIAPEEIHDRIKKVREYHAELIQPLQINKHKKQSKMRNKSYHYFLMRQIVLGTSIVPIGKAAVEQQAKNAQAIANYIEAKKKNPNARKEVIELRVDFVPFEYPNTKSSQKTDRLRKLDVSYQFKVALEKHDNKVANHIALLNHNAKKLYGIPSDATVNFYQGVRKIAKTSERRTKQK